jgi:hypothetical protein
VGGKLLIDTSRGGFLRFFGFSTGKPFKEFIFSGKAIGHSGSGVEICVGVGNGTGASVCAFFF